MTTPVPAHVASGRWPNGLLTVGRSVAVNARRFPEKLALSHASADLSYRALNERVNQLAHCLLDRGVTHGGHVAVLFGNTVEHVIAIYALAKIGAVSVVLDIKWVAREVAQALDIFDCSFLVYDGAYEDRVPSEARQTFGGRMLRYDGTDVDRSEFDAAFRRFPSDEPAVEVSDDDIYMLMLTSGTTGVPKGCIKSHKSYAHSCAVVSIGQRIDETSRELVVVPIYYNSGRVSLVSVLSLGGTVFLREKFDPKDVLETIARERITCIALAPTQCSALLDFPELDLYDKSSLRSLRKAGLPFQKRAVSDIMERICPNLFQAFGGTEFSEGTLLKPHEQLSKIGSSGTATWGTEVEVVDDSRNPLPPGREGEVRVRGPSVCSGYYKNDEANRVAFIDGWYYSGDIGRMDEDGYLYIVGRKKDIIKTGGINVAPREVEDVILAFPEIADVAVIGVQDDKWGEMIKALVVLRPGRKLSQDQIVARCREKLSAYKIPKVIEYVDELPRSPLGKITGQFKAAQQG
jgi:acyl-CoA synthetase (AMP-forming)/AMP-acid ligase II